jgi:hypothetical protein
VGDSGVGLTNGGDQGIRRITWEIRRSDGIMEEIRGADGFQKRSGDLKGGWIARTSKIAGSVLSPHPRSDPSYPRISFQ